jgi:hypothetical protein
MAQQRGGRSIMRSRSSGPPRAEADESVYAIGFGASELPSAQPRVRTFNVPIPKPQPAAGPDGPQPPTPSLPTGARGPLKSHADSTQVRRMGTHGLRGGAQG